MREDDKKMNIANSRPLSNDERNGREKDRIIGEWLGRKPLPYGDPRYCDLQFHKEYSSSDSDAIQLLPVLVERGYAPHLYFASDGNWWVNIFKSNMDDSVFNARGSTIAQAITTAVLQLIEKENENGV